MDVYFETTESAAIQFARDETAARAVACGETEQAWVIYSDHSSQGAGYFIEFEPTVTRDGERVVAYVINGQHSVEHALQERLRAAGE